MSLNGDAARYIVAEAAIGIFSPLPSQNQTTAEMNVTFSKQLKAAVALVYAVSAVSHAQTATTDPVGFITLNVYGGTPSNPKYSLVSPTLTQPITWQGAVAGVTGNRIDVAGTPFTANQFDGKYYVEVVSSMNPGKTGTLEDITATTGNSIATARPTGAVVGDTIKIRADVTIANLFGTTNSAGLLGSNADATGADEVLIYSGNLPPVSYFYYTGNDFSYTPGWVRSDDFTDGGPVTIAPNEAIVVKRKASGNRPVVFNGAVKTGNTLIPIMSGLTVLGTSSAKGLTLATSGLYTGNPVTGVQPSGGDASTADEIILYGATTPASYFFYSGNDFSYTPGWVKSDDFSDANNIAIAPGTAFVLKRKNGGAPFTWVLPSPTNF